MSEGFKWGEDLERDCAELKKNEEWGLYPAGHHDLFCPVEEHSPAPPVGPPATIQPEPVDTIDLPPREENTD